MVKQVLLVKTSSLGDVLHTLPAVTDAQLELAGQASIDWVVEESCAPIPERHRAVSRVIPVAMRRWRKRPFSIHNWSELRSFLRLVRLNTYDLVIDAQGLLKSAVIAGWSGAPVVGFDWHSAREPLASCFYSRKLGIPRSQHAIECTRQLFAKALGYPLPDRTPDYGLVPSGKACFSSGCRTLRLMLVHGSSWASKLWPEAYWRQLAKMISSDGHEVLIPWGNTAERQRAEAIALDIRGVSVLPRLGLSDLMAEMAGVDGAVCVDTGLGHLLAALNVPAVSIYGPTAEMRTGTRGVSQDHLLSTEGCSPCLKRVCRYTGRRVQSPPCFTKLTADLAWSRLQLLLERRRSSPRSS